MIGTFSADSFSVSANNAIELIAGTQAAGAGHVAANIQQMSRTLHTDMGQLTGTIVQQTNRLVDVNQAGFAQLGQTMSSGFSSLKALAGASLAVQTVGFAVVAKQLHGLRGDVTGLRADMVQQGKQLIDLQQHANARLESLVDFAARSLHTQERILETLVSSRTVEAQQLIRQGWDNLAAGYEDEAFSRFSKSLEFDNTVYLPHAQLAGIWRKRGDATKAEDHFVKATRFAKSAGKEVEAFARVQFAQFLEEVGRIDQCIDEVTAALQLTPKPAWRFYLAELQSRAGRTDAALASLREAIRDDDALFEAAPGSSHLAAMGAPFIEALVELDEARRTAALAPLLHACSSIDALESLRGLNPALSPRVDALMETLRAEGRTLAKAILTAPFRSVTTSAGPASAFQGKAQSALHAMEEDHASHLLSWASSWNRHYAELATSRPEAPRLPADGALYGLWLLSGASACGAVLALGGQAWLWAGGLALVAVAFGVFGMRRYTTRRGLEEAAGSHLKSWEATVAEAGRAARLACESAAATLQRYASTHPCKAFSEASERLRSLQAEHAPGGGDIRAEWRAAASAPYSDVPSLAWEGVLKTEGATVLAADRVRPSLRENPLPVVGLVLAFALLLTGVGGVITFAYGMWFYTWVTGRSGGKAIARECPVCAGSIRFKNGDAQVVCPSCNRTVFIKWND